MLGTVAATMSPSGKLVLTGNTKAITMFLAGLGVSTITVLTLGNETLFEAIQRLLSTASRARVAANDDALSQATLARLNPPQPPVVVMHGDLRGDRLTLIAVLGIGSGALWFAFRNKLVTRQSMDASIQNVGSKILGLSDKVNHIREKFQQAYDALARGQEEVRDDIADVADAVEEVKEEAKVISSGVRQCEASLIEQNRKQEFTCRGVQLLCGVLAESLPVTSKQKKRLESFLREGSHLLPPTERRSSSRRRFMSSANRLTDGPAAAAAAALDELDYDEAASSDYDPNADGSETLSSSSLSEVMPPRFFKSGH